MQVYEILWRSHSIPWGLGVCLFSDGHTWLRNCLGGTHVSCTWRPYLQRSCCKDHRRSILWSGLVRGVTAELKTSAPGPLQVQPQTLRFQNSHQPQIYCDLVLDLGLWHPSGLPASKHSPSVLQQAQNDWPSKFLY